MIPEVKRNEKQNSSSSSSSSSSINVAHVDRFNVFVAKSISLLEGEAPEVEEKAWNREETTWSLHGASVTCNGRGCTICNGESCESFVLASEAFRYFLSNLGVAGGQATFKGDRARAYASMEADLNRDEEFALDSGSQVNLCIDGSRSQSGRRVRIGLWLTSKLVQSEGGSTVLYEQACGKLENCRCCWLTKCHICRRS